MTAWRTAPVHQAETKGNNGKHHDATSHPVSAAAVGDQTPRATIPRSLSGSIKQLFREVKQALTAGIHLASEPRTRSRRRSGKTRSGFRLTAGILTRVMRSMFHTSGFLWQSPCKIKDARRQQLPWNSQASLYETAGPESDSGRSPKHPSPFTKETGRAFRLAASRVFRRIGGSRMILHTTSFANDMLSWLHLGVWDVTSETHDGQEELCERNHDGFSPRL
jgi:hypothetical protein